MLTAPNTIISNYNTHATRLQLLLRFFFFFTLFIAVTVVAIGYDDDAAAGHVYSTPLIDKIYDDDTYCTRT